LITITRYYWNCCIFSCSYWNKFLVLLFYYC